MKSIFLLFVLFAPLVLSFSLKTSNTLIATATTCNATESCASSGDSCVGDFSAPNNCNTSSAVANCCALGLYCISSSCKSDSFGSCSSTSNCYPPSETPNRYACNNGTCQYYYLAGDSCSATAPCDYGLNCSNSVCQGLAAGATCSYTSPPLGIGQCAFGLYCNPTGLSGVCANTTQTNGTCGGANPPCYPGLTCMNGKCIAMYSVASGGSCTNPNQCASGNTCSNHGNCTAVTTTQQTCTAQANCTNGGICTCSSVNGNQYCVGDPLYNPCTSEASALSSCLVSNQCIYATNAPGSCCDTHCSSDYTKSISCGCSGFDSLYGNCFYNQNCGGFPVWAIIVIIVVAIVLVLAIVLLVFFMMRRRRQYDSI